MFLAQRDAQDQWRTLSYAQTLDQVKRIAASLLRRGLSAERPIVILSGNSIEHALLALAAMYAGIPYAPVSPAYSLMSGDFGKLRMIVDLLTPGMVFAADGGPFARALYATVPDDIELVVGAEPARRPAGDDVRRSARRRRQRRRRRRACQGDAGHDRQVPVHLRLDRHAEGGDQHAPHAVLQPGDARGRLCLRERRAAGGRRLAAVEPHLRQQPQFQSGADERRLALHRRRQSDAAGRAEDRAQPARHRADDLFQRAEGLRGAGRAFPRRRALRKNFFSRLKVLFYAGASLNQTTWDELTDLSVAATGERVIFLSSLGSTETAPSALACTWDADRAGNIGVPFPGVELKLVPNEGKLEARLRGPLITPGYWRQEQHTRDAFDDEGFYKIGDALKFADANDPGKGLLFDGRLAEDFKLTSGTWVSVGPLRARFVDHLRAAMCATSFSPAPTATTLPAWCFRISRPAANWPGLAPMQRPLPLSTRQQCAPNLPNCSRPSPPDRARRCASCGSILMAEPPSLDKAEMTDKGSINQRAVLASRAALAAQLYANAAVRPTVIAI